MSYRSIFSNLIYVYFLICIFLICIFFYMKSSRWKQKIDQIQNFNRKILDHIYLRYNCITFFFTNFYNITALLHLFNSFYFIEKISFMNNKYFSQLVIYLIYIFHGAFNFQCDIWWFLIMQSLTLLRIIFNITSFAR